MKKQRGRRLKMPMPMVKKQFGGDTGIDADYYDENSEKYVDDK